MTTPIIHLITNIPTTGIGHRARCQTIMGPVSALIKNLEYHLINSYISKLLKTIKFLKENCGYSTYWQALISKHLA